MRQFNYNPSYTQSLFIQSQTDEVCLLGPRGEGKTEAAIVKMFMHSQTQSPAFRPVKWAIVRDSWTNLKRSTLDSFENPAPESIVTLFHDREAFKTPLEIKDGGTVVELPGFFKCWLLGCDNLADLDKFQGTQLGGIWFEEPAPVAMSNDISAGVDETTWMMAQTSLRQTLSTKPVAMITANYPARDHWLWRRFHEGVGTRALFEMQEGENNQLPSGYRDRMRQALIGNEGMMNRLSVGMPHEFVIGEPVLSGTYSSNFHVSKTKLMPVKGEAFRFWDGAHKAPCLIAQFVPSGQLQILDMVTGESGVYNLIHNELLPLLGQKYSMITKWRDIGDPAMVAGDLSNKNISQSGEVEKYLHTTFESGPTGWSERLSPLRRILGQMVRPGEPMLLISNHLTFLDKALRVGWHFNKTHQGIVQKERPVKDDYSHPCDALTYGIAKLFKYDMTEEHYDMSRYKKRAASYGHEALWSGRMIRPDNLDGLQ